MKDQNETDVWKEAFRNKLPDIPVSGNNDAEIWDNLRAQITSAPQIAAPTRYLWYAVAASISLFIGVSALVFQYRVSKSPGPITRAILHPEKTAIAVQQATQSEAPVLVEAPKTELRVDKNTSIAPVRTKLLAASGKIKPYVLADGSVVTLNQTAALEAFTDLTSPRNVTLTGEAYFNITPNKNKPFTVHFGELHLVVLGTKFNVRPFAKNAYEITVTEGVVEVFDQHNSGTIVRKGQQLWIAAGMKPRWNDVDTKPYVFWTSGQYAFHKNELKDVATVLSRRFEFPIELAPEIATCRFSGDLSDATEEEALEILKTSLDLTVIKNDKTYFISGKACE